MTTEPTTPDAVRLRLLEGVLLRLARRPDVGEFVLRGGMLLRHWFRPVPRTAGDLDLVATFPFDVDEAARRFLPVFSESIDDGVSFDCDRLQVVGIWLDTGNPGVRVFASGVADGIELDFNVDITFGPYPRPAPVCSAIPTGCGAVAEVWTCRPEAVVGQKVQALRHLGMLGWRPKDLNDLRLLLDLVPMDAAALRAAIATYLTDLGRPLTEALELFAPSSWWGMKLCSARWLDFVKASREQDVPRDLAGVAANIAGHLNPILEGLP
jgi:Nucleotidyl transferase AbiEii toxin, Type IV TA system